MPRRPDVPCAGTCGKLIWGGRKSLPAGQAMCRPCRAVRSNTKSCSSCGAAFEVTRAGGGWTPSTCSLECARTARRQNRKSVTTWAPRPCADCSAMTSTCGTVALCDACRGVRQRARWRRKNVIRRGAAVAGQNLTIAQLGDRDGWRCHLCRRQVSKLLRSPHPRSASFDHLIPVSYGGTDAPENLRLAHRGCNSRRGNRGDVQLQLVG